MMWLLFSILSSAGLMVVFKFFVRYEVRVFPAIVVNYATCFACGNLRLGSDNLFAAPVWTESWFLPVALLGLLFISTFYLTGTATRTAGASATSVAGKMSVVIPAAYSVIALHEKPGIGLLAGMLLSLVCVYLMRPETPQEHKRHTGLLLLLLVFAGSGMVDTGLNMLKHRYGTLVSDDKLSTIVFGSAGLVGLTVMIFGGARLRPGLRELAGGITLGLVNYLSLLAMFGAIGHYKGQSAWFFALNNIGVVAVSTLASVLFFSEKVEKRGYLGLALAVVAILLMNLNG